MIDNYLIRNAEHTVTEAITRQLSISNNVGQNTIFVFTQPILIEC